MSERTILDMEKRGEFPQRFSIGARVVAWDLTEIDAWITQREIAATRQAVPGAKGSR